MAFKIRDLMITDLTGSEGTHLRLGSTGSRCSTRECGPPPFRVGGCRYSASFGTDPAHLLEQLALLKAQLKQELAEVEKEEAALEADLLPSSLAEVEDLQAKLAAAAEDLARLKEELKIKQG